MLGKLPKEAWIMRGWSNSSVPRFIDAIAIAIAKGYMLARASGVASLAVPTPDRRS